MRPWRLAALVLGFYLAFAGIVLHRRHWDASVLIVAGDYFVDRGKLASPIAVQKKSVGYDGEFYYRLALDPFTSKKTDFGVTIDNPATRGARIVYPLLVWMVTAGQAALVPWGLLGVNLAGVFLMAWIACALVRARGFPAWIGLGVPLYPGFMLTLVRDTTEITAAVFGIAALSLACRQRFWWASLAGCAAVMTRETTLFYLAGFGLVEAWNSVRRRQWSWALVPLLLPLLVFVSWQRFVAWHWGQSSYTGTARNLGAPFVGLWAFLSAEMAALRAAPWMSFDFKLHADTVLLAVLCLALAALAGWQVARRRVEPGLAVAWALCAVLLVCLTNFVWVEPFDFMRGFSDLFVVGATAVALTGDARSVQMNFLVLAPTWLCTVLFIFRV